MASILDREAQPPRVAGSLAIPALVLGRHRRFRRIHGTSSRGDLLLKGWQRLSTLWWVLLLVLRLEETVAGATADQSNPPPPASNGSWS